MDDERRGNIDDSDEVILSELYNRLAAFGRCRFGNKIYASESYQDCLQKIIVPVWQRRLWERLASEEVYHYACTSLVNCLRDAFRRVKRADLLFVNEVEPMPASRSAVLGSFGVQQELELVAEVEWVKSLFQGDNTMLTYIEKLSLGKTRKEIASEMKLTPRQVTDLARKLKRTVKRHLKERGLSKTIAAL
jgi:DNA-directed RNA polymerase specialized sigma24 family protein